MLFDQMKLCTRMCVCVVFNFKCRNSTYTSQEKQVDDIIIRKLFVVSQENDLPQGMSI